ncbi:MAG: hypothetical protein H0W72_00595 [Planctomycetes bacterium]|nr:hypothetical protein [Planctomycetota bacterium]
MSGDRLQDTISDGPLPASRGSNADAPRLLLGLFDEVAATTTSGQMRDRALIFSGRAETVAADPNAPLLADALVALDRVEEIAEHYPNWQGAGYQAAQIWHWADSSPAKARLPSLRSSPPPIDNRSLNTGPEPRITSSGHSCSVVPGMPRPGCKPSVR